MTSDPLMQLCSISSNFKIIVLPDHYEAEQFVQVCPSPPCDLQPCSVCVER